MMMMRRLIRDFVIAFYSIRLPDTYSVVQADFLQCLQIAKAFVCRRMRFNVDCVFDARCSLRNGFVRNLYRVYKNKHNRLSLFQQCDILMLLPSVQIYTHTDLSFCIIVIIVAKAAAVTATTAATFVES